MDAIAVSGQHRYICPSLTLLEAIAATSSKKSKTNHIHNPLFWLAVRPHVLPESFVS